MSENISVRQWQENFRDGAYNSSDFATQCKAGWYDWFCENSELADRLKELAEVVMGITDPFILDNYYAWFKNNCPMRGDLYDDVRFDLLSGERGGKYFLVSLDSPYETSRYALYTERHGYEQPEFECERIAELTSYINGMARELAEDKTLPSPPTNCPAKGKLPKTKREAER